MIDIDDTFGLRGRMERAVGGLKAPDVMSSVMAHAHRYRAQRRVKYAAGGVAAVAAAGAIGYPLVQSTSSGRADLKEAPSYAGQPGTDGTVKSGPEVDDNGCPVRPAGWWDMPADQVLTSLAGRLPAGVTVGQTADATPGTWSGNLVRSADPDFASVSLLPPPVQGTQPDSGDDGFITLCPTWEPMQEVEACGAATNCEEIRDDQDDLIGVVTENVETTIDNGQEVPTDKTYFLATLAGPDGGHVEIYVGEGTRADVPSTPHDPADEPALTLEQVTDLVTDSVWTSYAG